jgi:BirA family biotin operon repressor/biotin-[acetyl-CoA-carboxylase] ligase
VALELARADASHGATVVAEGQTAGRGRLGRSFFSPPYLNLYTSIVLRPRLSTAEAPTLILAAGVAVADAVADMLGDPRAVEIKWPNDVLLGGLKTSGILMELGAEATRVAFLVLGIGVNLNVPRESFPDEFRSLATSLASHAGRRIDRVAFARRLYHGLEEVLDAHAQGGFAAIRPRFEARFRMPGREIRVRELDGRETGGRCAGIDDDGALLLDAEDGRRQRLVAGDVTIVKRAEGRP